MDGKSGEYIFEPNFNVLTFFILWSNSLVAMEHFFAVGFLVKQWEIITPLHP